MADDRNKMGDIDRPMDDEVIGRSEDEFDEVDDEVEDDLEDEDDEIEER